MKFTVKITYTTLSGKKKSTRYVSINTATPAEAMRVADGVAQVLEKGPGRAKTTIASSGNDDSISLEDAILWAVTGGGE